MLTRPLLQRAPLMLCALLLLLTCAPVVRAEFLRTRPDTFQSTDERSKIIVSREDPGIFIAFGRPLNIQLFDPEQLQTESSRHVFISYDPALSGYTKLTFGNRKSYRIIGSLSFLVGSLKISIDNNHGYCSISEVEGDESTLGIIGFRGIEPVARYKGTVAAALLEANQLESYQRVVKSFEFNGESLTLNQQPVDASAVGLSFELPANPCIPGKDKVFLNNRQLDRIRVLIDARERLKYLETLLKQQRNNNPLDKLILIRISDQSALGIDYERGVVASVKPFSDSRDNQICVVEDVGM